MFCVCVCVCVCVQASRSGAESPREVYLKRENEAWVSWCNCFLTAVAHSRKSAMVALHSTLAFAQMLVAVSAGGHNVALIRHQEVYSNQQKHPNLTRRQTTQKETTHYWSTATTLVHAASVLSLSQGPTRSKAARAPLQNTLPNTAASTISA